MATKFLCDNCGAELLPDAKFCGKCGNKVEEKTLVADVPVESKKKSTSKRSVQSARPTKSPKQFKILIRVLCAAIGLNVLSGLIEFSDVREYYTYGQLGSCLISLWGIALDVWLLREILRRKNWARKTFILYTVVGVILTLLSFAAVENGFDCALSIVWLVAQIYCVKQLTGSEMAMSFIKTNEDAKSVKVFWGCVIALLVFATAYTRIYTATNWATYLDNCASAAARGSESAYSELIGCFAEHSDEAGGEEEITDAAVKAANELIATKRPEEKPNNGSSRENGKSKDETIWDMFRKNGGKIVAGLAAFCGAFKYTVVPFLNWIGELWLRFEKKMGI